jgi:hypothetical protein
VLEGGDPGRHRLEDRTQRPARLGEQLGSVLDGDPQVVLAGVDVGAVTLADDCSWEEFVDDAFHHDVQNFCS